ncbi:hypothetical protein B7P43_G01869 [Cryptotermes secundus]|uniref:Uncharacterized protein n=1 Tax=Cryptotermes secundus TaxID=105785 RepID=A0A2J7QWH1_9NEOP|nr:hypothetical protein B7P43_G01869 [Cryptotermes secundus]
MSVSKSFKVAGQAGRPSITTDEKIQQAREMVLANRRVAIDEVACSLQIIHDSAQSNHPRRTRLP